MKKLTVRFLNDETGTVSVDWIVMSAVVLGLGFAAVSAAQSGIEAISQGLLDGHTTSLHMTVKE